MRKNFLLLFISVSLLLATAGASAVDYDIKVVSDNTLVARLYLPRVKQKVPVVIAFGGSEGGLHMGNANAELLAPQGIAVLALAYFKEDGLPPTLDQIPLEYFIKAIDYLQTVPEVDASRIGVLSGSRGSEAAFLLASMDTRITSLVVTTPSKVAWYGRTLAKSAWTLAGKDVPALNLELDEKAAQVSRFEAALAHPANVEKALFAVEKINGPILLISAEQDQIWPSTQMSKDIVSYLKERHFPHSVVHHSYPTGHGFSQETAPQIKQSIIDHFLRSL